MEKGLPGALINGQSDIPFIFINAVLDEINTQDAMPVFSRSELGVDITWQFYVDFDTFSPELMRMKSFVGTGMRGDHGQLPVSGVNEKIFSFKSGRRHLNSIMKRMFGDVNGRAYKKRAFATQPFGERFLLPRLLDIRSRINSDTWGDICVVYHDRVF